MNTPTNSRRGEKHKITTPETKQEKEKLLRTDSPSVINVEDFPALPQPSQQPPSSQPQTDQSDNDKTPKVYCLCGGKLAVKTAKLKCTTCTRMWHSDCVGLKGSTVHLLSKLEAYGWNCPKCFMFSDEIIEALNADNADNIADNTADNADKMVPQELDKVGRLIKREINAMIPKVISGVEEKIREGCFNNVFKDAGHEVSKSWVEIARGDQHKIINDAVQATSDIALQRSMKLIDSNLTERKKRSRNIIISNVPENSRGANLTEVVCNKLNESLNMPEGIR